MTISTAELWTVIILLGFGCFLIRFVFLGVIGDRPLAPWILRHLRYTAVSILPALVAPLVVWPSATNGEADPARMTAAILTFAVGYWTKNVLLAIGVGAATLWAMLFLL